MTYDKNYSGSAGTTGATTGTTSGTGAYGRSGSYGSTGSYGSGYGSSQAYGSQGYGAPYSSGYENWSGNWSPAGGGSGKMLLGLLVGAGGRRGGGAPLWRPPRDARRGRTFRAGRATRAARPPTWPGTCVSASRSRPSRSPATPIPGTPMNEDRNMPEL
jgi:hypothetical protein